MHTAQHNTQTHKHTGKVCLGIECDDVTANGNDGSFSGERYFACDPGKGTFVLPQRIIKKLKSSTDVSDSDSYGYSYSV